AARIASASQRSRSAAGRIGRSLVVRGLLDGELRGQGEAVATGARIGLQRAGQRRRTPQLRTLELADQRRGLAALPDQQDLGALDRELLQVGRIGQAAPQLVEYLDRGRAPGAGALQEV